MVLSGIMVSAAKGENPMMHTICTQKEMRRVLPLAPLDPVDLLLNLQRF